MATLGLRANARQFWLLVLVNAFVGGTVGLERSILPLLAEREFGIASGAATLSFLISFGIVKACANLAAGGLSDRYGRKRVLVAGWLLGIPVPLLIMLAPTWGWIVFANLLLGANQGLTWSTTVAMKIDLAGPARRGFAMGLNEFAGYLAVALAALASAAIAERWGLRPEPFYLGVVFVAAGLALSLLLVKDTSAHVLAEAGAAAMPARPERLGKLLVRSMWSDKALSSASQAGLMNNLNDGVAWGIFPLMFASSGLSLREIGWLAFAYPASWGCVQLWTGALSDRYGRRGLIAGGMFLQAAALLFVARWQGFRGSMAGCLVLGVGTAMVYPTLLASVADSAPPTTRATALGVYRFWRDSGYALGALSAGILADTLGMSLTVVLVAIATAGSGVIVLARMPETRARRNDPGAEAARARPAARYP
ncbi:MAG: MFS transporter [Gemmatimonadales bacterium]|nr:MFS transporter [Gemmatimonadales bacterium]